LEEAIGDGITDSYRDTDDIGNVPRGGGDLPKTWLETENPASWTTSLPKNPSALPLPYLIEKELVKLVKELDCDGLKVWTSVQ
jgi:hypothetical protein